MLRLGGPIVPPCSRQVAVPCSDSSSVAENDTSVPSRTLLVHSPLVTLTPTFPRPLHTLPRAQPLSDETSEDDPGACSQWGESETGCPYAGDGVIGVDQMNGHTEKVRLRRVYSDSTMNEGGSNSLYIHSSIP